MRKRTGEQERGAGLILVVLLVGLSMVLTGGLVSLINSTTRQTTSARMREEAYGVAEAAINQTIFKMEAAMGNPAALKDIETYLTDELGVGHAGTRDFAGSLENGNYTVTLRDPVAGDTMFQLDATARLTSGASRDLTAMVRGEPVTALNYALFGNYIHFDNHNKVAFGVTLNTSIFSNSGILIDKGIRIMGPVQAVQFIRPNTGPSSGEALPDSVLSPAGQQGDPDPSPVVATAPVVQVQPPPGLQPFPSFDFASVGATAATAGRSLTAAQFTTLLNNARAYALTLTGAADLTTDLTNVQFRPLPAGQYPVGISDANVPVSVVHYKSADPAQHRKIHVPNVDNPGMTVELGSPDGVAAGPADTYEIIFEGNPLPNVDSLIYVPDPLTISLATDTLMRMEGSLAVNGQFTLHAASEMLAWENRQAPWFVPLGTTLYDFAQNAGDVANPAKDIRYYRYPAIAANGGIKIDKSGAGMGGPTHIEGAVYTVAESHLHRSDARERAYSVGSEIADTIHNCEFFSFAYDPEARSTLGFSNRLTGRPRLMIVRLEAR